MKYSSIMCGLHQLRGQVVRRRFWVDQSFYLLCLPVLFCFGFFGNCVCYASFTELFTNINTYAMTPCPGFSLSTCQWVIEIWERLYPSSCMTQDNSNGEKVVPSIFRRSRAANSIVNGGIWPKFKLIQAFMHVLITCKYEKDPIKNSRENVMT